MKKASEHWAECAAFLEAHCQDGFGFFPDGAMRYAMTLWVLCEAIGVKRVVEVGIGATSMSGTVFIHSMGSRGGGSLLSLDIDPRRPKDIYKELAESKNVIWEQIYGDSLVTQIPDGTEADLVYVDGDHDREHAYQDALQCLKVLRPGGYFVIDDYPGSIGVVEAMAQLESEGYRCIHIPHDPPSKQSNGRLIWQKPEAA